MLSTHKCLTVQHICLVLFRKESRSLGFSVVMDVRKSATKRKYLENIVEAMVCFQVGIEKNSKNCLFYFRLRNTTLTTALVVFLP